MRPTAMRAPTVAAAALAATACAAATLLGARPSSGTTTAAAEASAHEVGAMAQQSVRVGPGLGLGHATGPVGDRLGAHVAPATRRSAVASACTPGPTPTTTTSTTTTTTSTTSTTTSTTTTTTSTTTTTTLPSSTTTSGLLNSSPSSTAATTTTTTLPSGTTTSLQPTTTTTLPASSTTTPPSVPTPFGAAAAYYLVENNGGVHPYGGAGFFGSKASKHLSAPVIGAAVTADGAGYWLATAKGNVYPFGDARYFGSPVHVRHLRPVAVLAATPDGQGYWLVTRSGSVYNYGDAQFCGSAVHDHVANSVVGFASTPDGAGYWIVTAAGTVYNYGDAASYAPAAHAPYRAPVVGIASSVDGKGYWLVSDTGAVYNFGDARFLGSTVHKTLHHLVVSLTSTADGAGYWVTTSTGRIFNFGDAHFTGSLARTQPRRPLAVVGLVRTALAGASTATSPFPHGVFGYDISNYQCARGKSSVIEANPPKSSAVSVIGVTGWLDSAENSCLASQAAWAVKAAGTTGGPYSLYIFMNSPGTNAAAVAQDANGPAGACGSLIGNNKLTCQAYNYGYNGAKNALAYASSRNVVAKVWWLDIEKAQLSTTPYSAYPGAFWSDSTTLNDETIQGALDALHQGGLTVGIYSTSVQYPTIAGAFVPSGPRVPLWIAGVPWTNPPFTEKGLFAPSVLSAWCAGTATYVGFKHPDAFAGGVPWLLQETPGNEPSPYGLDPDYAC